MRMQSNRNNLVSLWPATFSLFAIISGILAGCARQDKMAGISQVPAGEPGIAKTER